MASVRNSAFIDLKIRVYIIHIRAVITVSIGFLYLTAQN